MEAVVITEKLCLKTDYKVPEYMRTLATVYGGFGRYDEAITVAMKGSQQATAQSKPVLAKIFDNMVSEFQRKKLEKQNPTSAPTSRPTGQTDSDGK